MSAFLDDSASGTGGSGLMVDGVEANRAIVSASAVQEVRINQDRTLRATTGPGAVKWKSSQSPLLTTFMANLISFFATEL